MGGSSASDDVTVADEPGVVVASAPLAASQPSVRAGRYLVIEEIGRGGMGVVVRAYDPRLQREVALKSMRGEVLSHEARVRMLREAQAMAKLSHPNVVGVYDVEVVDGAVVLAMEYVRGTTLRQWLVQERPWQDIVKVFVAAGRGLAAAHAASLLHRDFKPANVLVGEDGRARVTDFGLARGGGSSSIGSSPIDGEADLTEAGTILGTPRYMAPEQHDGEVLDPAADQYAFCLALWEGLTRRPPFDGNRDTLVVRKQLGPPPWPREVPVPAAIRDALRRGLAADPSERWPSMNALLDVLSTASVRRRRVWLPAVGVVGLLAASGLVGAAQMQQLAQRCSGATKHLENVWDGVRREQVERALVATGAAYAQDVWTRVAPKLDAYATAWAQMHTETCAATTIRSEQPAQVMDLRMACLRRAKVDLRATTDLLVVSDAQVAEKAHQLVANLPPLRACADLDALLADVPPPAPADQERVEAVRVALAEVKALRLAGKYAETVERTQALVDEAQRIDYGPLVTEAMLELGFASKSASEYERAEAALKAALRSAVANEQWDRASFAASHLVDTVGSLLTRPSEALVYAETAKGLLDEHDGLAQADLRNHTGAVFYALGRYTEAEGEYRTAIALRDAAGGDAHLTVSGYEGNLGISLNAQGRLQEAEEVLRSDVARRERVLGPEHPETLHAHYDLATTLFLQLRYTEAEALHRRVLAGWQKTLGPKHALTCSAHVGLGNVLMAQGRDAEAVEHFEAALAVEVELLGPDHANVSNSRSVLANALVGAGRHAEGEAQMREALVIDEKVYGPEHPYTAGTRSRFSLILVQRGQYAEAESQARLAVATLQRSHVAEHHETAYAQRALATALMSRGDYAEAEALLTEAVEIARASLGPKHGFVGRLLNSLGGAIEAQRRYAEAQARQEEALALVLESMGPEHPLVAVTRGQLGSTLRAQGRYDEAQGHYADALASLARVLGPDHPDLVELQWGLARALLEGGKVREALRSLERHWSMWREDRRVQPSLRARLAFGLARALWLTGGDRSRARSLAHAARGLFDQMPPRSFPRERAELDAWLREHG